MANDTRTRMIEATALLLRQRGYHGTSLNDILSASGAPRGSLYFHFPGGKDQLVIEVTRDSVDKVTQRLGEELAAEKDPAVAVHHIYQAVARMLEDNQFTLGCPIAPVVLDSPADVPELAELCRSAFEQWIGLLQATFVRAGVP
ncbi:MAG: TetR/AcrR family transcriptional regulator, partial [Mesorhizobium sp.]